MKVLVAIFLVALGVNGATLRRVALAPHGNGIGPATEHFLSRILRRKLQSSTFVTPDYWRFYRRKFGKKYKLCAWLEERGLTLEEDESCEVRRGKSYYCFRGEQTCTSTDSILSRSTTHPTLECTCDAATQKFSCEAWDPCTSSTDRPTSAPAGTQLAPPVQETMASPTASPVASPTSSPTTLPTGSPIGISQDTTLLQCQIDSPFFLTENKDDVACETLNYVCVHPFVKWSIPGCGCGCERPQDAVIATTCPDTQPKLMDFCDFDDPDETCGYGSSCCCGDCRQPTSCSCTNNHFVCSSEFRVCELCQAGGICSATQSCESGLQCVDDATDACNPSDGDSDCEGVCVPEICPKEENGYTYVYTDYAKCDDSKPYPCADDEIRWSQDGCGCGCKKSPEVLDLGVVECPASYNDARSSDVVCDIDLRCAWGEESCCGETHDSLVCSCMAGGGFDMCYYTDACMAPDCRRNCPSEAPTTGEACESVDFAGFMSFDPLSFGEPGFCGYGTLDCTCSGTVSIGVPDYEQECKCVDDKWECLPTPCDLICPTVSSPEQGELGGFCGGIAGLPCNDGLTCIDDPNDSCSPVAGGADCGGVCLSASCPIGPKVIYKGFGETCTNRDVSCEPGFESWSEEDCGCGCKPVDEVPVQGDEMDVCPPTAQGSCDPEINNEACDFGIKMCPKTCGSSELVASGADHSCKCDVSGNWVCRATGCGVCVAACPLERPKVGDECFVLETCTYGVMCGCGDEKFSSFDCVGNKFVESENQLLCLQGCPEEDPNFPSEIDGQPCTESGGIGIDCTCSCGGPCGPEYNCNCNTDGKYECNRVHSPFITCACAAPPVAIDADGNVVKPTPSTEACPDTPPTVGDACNIPNERCGYDEVCGVNQTTFDCSQWNNEWQRPRKWIAPDCPSDLSLVNDSAPALPVLDILPIQDEPQLLPPIIVQDQPELDPIVGLLPPRDPWVEPDQQSTGSGSTKKKWPEWLGKKCDPDALEAIKSEPHISTVLCIPEGSFVTLDVRVDRVRIFFDDDPSSPTYGLVTSEPHVG